MGIQSRKQMKNHCKTIMSEISNFRLKKNFLMLFAGRTNVKVLSILTLLLLYVPACGKKKRVIHPPPRYDKKVIGSSLLRMVPFGSDFLLWGDLAKLRRWGPIKNLMNEDGEELKNLVSRFQQVHGLDPWKELDQVLITAPLQGPRKTIKLVLKGEGIGESLLGSMPTYMQKLGKGELKKSSYREVMLLEVGGMCLGFPQKDVVLSASGIWVRRAVDIVRGITEKPILENKELLNLWRSLTSERMGGKPVILAAGIIPEELSNRISGELGIGVRLESIGFRIRTGSWLGVKGVIQVAEKKQANKLVMGIKRWIGGVVKSPKVQDLGIGDLVNLLFVHSEGKTVYMQFNIPGELFERLVRLTLKREKST